MNEENDFEPEELSAEERDFQKRREFLGSLGKWSGASAIAAVGGAAWISTPGTAQAASWINRRGGGGWINGGGGWVNRGGGGGSWVNRRGGGGWINRR